MSSSASRLLLQPPMKTRTPLFSGSKQSPATENLADGPSPTVVTFVHTPVSANIGRQMPLRIISYTRQNKYEIRTLCKLSPR